MAFKKVRGMEGEIGSEKKLRGEDRDGVLKKDRRRESRPTE